MKKVLLLIALTLSLSSCAWWSSMWSSKDKEYDDVVVQAQNEIKLADKTGFLWRDTEKFLKDAEEAKAAGDMDKAIKLAQKALKQAQMAQQQAKDNAAPVVRF
ncbi:MAG: hypothetical protein HY081_04390 [Gammaproteobacteria bacterium]|nr:hypothetical protein [Gammaproteobacteria bacterium]